VGIFMKIKNIVQIATLAGLIISGSTKPMMVGAALKKAAQWSLQKAGTALGLGLPTYEFFKEAGQRRSSLYKKPTVTQLFPDAIPLDKESTAILKKHLKSDINIMVLPNIFSRQGLEYAACYNGTILLSKRYESSKGYSKIGEILKGEDTELKRTVIAMAQHEEGHHIHNHTPKGIAATAFIPALITATTALTCKRWLPYNCVGRFFTKVIGGLLLVPANSFAVSYIAHQREFQADQNVSPENREALAYWLNKQNSNTDKLLTDLQLQIQFRIAGLNNEESKRAITLTNKLLGYFDRHPPVEERIKRLQQSSTKTV
jgi:hypothetical protein